MEGPTNEMILLSPSSEESSHTRMKAAKLSRSSVALGGKKLQRHVPSSQIPTSQPPKTRKPRHNRHQKRLRKLIIRNEHQSTQPNTATPTAERLLFETQASPIRATLTGQYFIFIPAEDISVKLSRVNELKEHFKEYKPASVKVDQTGWYIVFGNRELAMINCFEHFKLLDFQGTNFRMEVIGKNGEVLMHARKEVLQPEDEFDEDWVGFDLLRTVTAYCRPS